MDAATIKACGATAIAANPGQRLSPYLLGSVASAVVQTRDDWKLILVEQCHARLLATRHCHHPVLEMGRAVVQARAVDNKVFSRESLSASTVELELILSRYGCSPSESRFPSCECSTPQGAETSARQAARIIHVFAFEFGSWCAVLEDRMAAWLIALLLMVHIPTEVRLLPPSLQGHLQ